MEVMMKNLVKELKVTTSVKTDENAVEDRMKSLNPKLFGVFNPMPYELKSKQKVFLPYELMVFSYKLTSGKSGNSGVLKGFDKQGEIGIIFDFNEVHGFHFDLSEELSLKSLQADRIDGEILPKQCTDEEAMKKAKDLITRKFLNRPFKNTEVTLIRSQKFYRAAWDLDVTARGNDFHRYAYVDTYGSSNEHISGLKLRLNI